LPLKAVPDAIGTARCGQWCHLLVHGAFRQVFGKKVSSKMFFNFVMSASNVMKFLAYTSDEL
jgi:hypothetical protein